MYMRCAVAALVALILAPAGCTFPGQDAALGPTALTVRITALVAGGQKTILVRTPGEEVRDLRIGAGLRRITPPFGTITGRVMSVGGPYPGTKRPMANEQIIVTGHDADRIRLRTGVRSGSSGGFRISLPAGRYTVRTPGGGPHHSVRVQVTPDGLVHVRLVRDIY